MSFPSATKPLVDKFTFDSQELLKEELEKATLFEKSNEQGIVTITSHLTDSEQVHPLLMELDVIPRITPFIEPEQQHTWAWEDLLGTKSTNVLNEYMISNEPLESIKEKSKKHLKSCMDELESNQSRILESLHETVNLTQTHAASSLAKYKLLQKAQHVWTDLHLNINQAHAHLNEIICKLNINVDSIDSEKYSTLQTCPDLYK